MKTFSEVEPLQLEGEDESLVCKSDGWCIDVLVDDAPVVIAERQTAIALRDFITRALGDDK